jgi:hypothetical protein
MLIVNMVRKETPEKHVFDHTHGRASTPATTQITEALIECFPTTRQFPQTSHTPRVQIFGATREHLAESWAESLVSDESLSPTPLLPLRLPSVCDGIGVMADFMVRWHHCSRSASLQRPDVIGGGNRKI